MAALWRTAALHAATGDAHARQALRLAEARLRELNPLLMDAYTRHRAAGLNLADAMRAAAYDLQIFEERSRARPHGAGGAPPAAVRATGPAIGGGPGEALDTDGELVRVELDETVRAQVARLASGVAPDLVDGLARRARTAGRAPAADAATRLADAARRLRAEAQLSGPVTGTTTIRRGVNHPSEHLQPPAVMTVSTEDIPVRSADAGLGFAGDALEHAAAQARAHQAEAAHVDGLGDQQQPGATIAGGAPDVPVTPIDEHRDGVDTGRRYRGVADQYLTAADQQARLGRAFPPLTVVDPESARTPPGTRATQRRGRAR